jgi:asparagine synthase (glutamine-hydrolysing)
LLREQFHRAWQGQPIFWGGATALTGWQKNRILSRRLKQKFAGQSSWDALRPLHDKFRQSAWQQTDLAWMSYLDLKLRLPELLLMRMDKMSMAVGLEARVPFLDHVFVETAMSIPSDLVLRGGELKYILKRAVRGLIPDANIDRPKQGFGVPIHDWFLDRLGSFARDTLEQFCRRTDYFDRREVLRLFEKRKSRRIWFLLNFAMWWNQFIGGQSLEWERPAAAA